MTLEKLEKKQKRTVPYIFSILALECYLIGAYAAKSWDPSVQIKKCFNRVSEIRWETKQREYLIKVLDVAADKNGSGKFEADEKAKRNAYLERIKEEKPSLKELEKMIRNYE